MNTPTASAPQNALLFIPDISGFTQFVNDTEIAHSQHIVEELLEQIIDANDIQLTLAEVEGDALLFYRLGSPPTAAELLAQVQRMFISFHSHLKRYELQRLCQCGACCSAPQLTLKFFGHYGEVTMNKVKDVSKPFGRHVILIHRLMKNAIPGSEYALFTEDLAKACANWVDITQVAWAPPVAGEETYDAGQVSFSYIALDPLRHHVPPPAITDYSIPGATDLIMSSEVVIEAPIEMVFDILSDLSFKTQWVIGLKGVDRLNHKITRPGSTHRCVTKGKDGDPSFVNHGYDISRDQITFVESNHRDKLAIVYVLRRLGKGLTRVETSFLIKPNLIKKMMFNLLMKKQFIREFRMQNDNINTYCKQLIAEGRLHPNHIELGFGTA